MTTLSTQGISLYYEVHGNPDNPAVLLLSGLAGTGRVGTPRSSGSQPSTTWWCLTSAAPGDHPQRRGPLDRATWHRHGLSGRTARSGPGACGRRLDRRSHRPTYGAGPPTHRAPLTLVASFARFDAFMQREFQARRHMAAEWDRTALLSAYSVFLFSPRYARHHPEKVTAWVQRAGAQPTQPQDVDISLKRIDMIAAHDTLPRLHQLAPTHACPVRRARLLHTPTALPRTRRRYRRLRVSGSRLRPLRRTRTRRRLLPDRRRLHQEPQLTALQYRGIGGPAVFCSRLAPESWPPSRLPIASHSHPSGRLSP